MYTVANETDISAKEAQAFSNPRVLKAHAKRQWSRGFEASTPEGARSPLGIVHA